MLSFADEEFTRRLDRFREVLGRKGLRAAIVTRPENIFYLTGYRAAHIAARTSELHAVVVPHEGLPTLICRSLEAQTVKEQWTPAPLLFDDAEDPYPLLAGLLGACGAAGGQVGIEERWLKVSQLRRIQVVAPVARLLDVSGELERIAAAPSEAERACMRAAAQIAEIGMTAGLSAIGPGLRPYEVIGRIHEAMYLAGQSDFDKSLVAVWAGPRGGRMHDTLTTEPINAGDVVTVEIMGVDRHYRAGVQCCVYVGNRPPADVAEAYDLVVRMHQAASATIRAGVTGAEIFRAASEVYQAATGREYYRRVGGSMGLTQFAYDLVKANNEPLTAGISLLVQTLVDTPVLLTCANTITVTESGVEALTAPRIGLTAPR